LRKAQRRGNAANAGADDNDRCITHLQIPVTFPGTDRIARISSCAA
jgi:hypothetical protein